VIYHGRASRRAIQVARSQFAVRIGLALYAAICVAMMVRCTVLALGFPATVGTVEAILAISAPLARPLAMVAPADRAVIGSATLADLTTALVLFAVPLPFLGRRGVA
jgi:hypothetical protein